MEAGNATVTCQRSNVDAGPAPLPLEIVAQGEAVLDIPIGLVATAPDAPPGGDVPSPNG